MSNPDETIIRDSIFTCPAKRFVGSTSGPVRYAAAHIIAAGAYSFGSLCNSWASSNVTSDTARNGAIAAVVMAGNTGGVVATVSPTLFVGNQYAYGLL